MAVIGFILLNAETGKEHEVQEALSGIDELSDRYALRGLSTPKEHSTRYGYDFLVIIHSTDSTALERFVINRIEPIPGIVGIKTVLGMSFTIKLPSSTL